MAPQFPLSARGKPQRHQRAVVRLVGLKDGHEGHAGPPEGIGKLHQLPFARRRQRDGEGARLKVAGTRLTGRMHQLRGLHTPRKIGPDDGVMADRVLVSPCARGGPRLRVAVVASSWAPS
jgi:hypothetical protein